MKSNLRIRFLSAALAFVLLFTACGSNAGTPDNKVDSTEDTQVSVEKEDTDVVTTPTDDTEEEVVEEGEITETPEVNTSNEE